MEVLRLQIKPKHIGKQDVQRAGKVAYGIRLEFGRCCKRSLP
jgi:hypothetical protein